MLLARSLLAFLQTKHLERVTLNGYALTGLWQIGYLCSVWPNHLPIIPFTLAFSSQFSLSSFILQLAHKGRLYPALLHQVSKQGELPVCPRSPQQQQVTAVVSTIPWDSASSQHPMGTLSTGSKQQSYDFPFAQVTTTRPQIWPFPRALQGLCFQGSRTPPSKEESNPLTPWWPPQRLILPIHMYLTSIQYQ